MAINNVLNNADEPAEQNNIPIFHHDDLGRFMPTTRKAKALNRARYLHALCARHRVHVDPDLTRTLFDTLDAHAASWTTHAINRFPQQLVPDDCNYIAATSLNISPDERLTLHKAAVSLTERYDNPLADQEPVPDIIRTILRETDPAHSAIPENLDQYAHRTGNLAAMLASILATPLQHPEHYPIAIALIGRIIRTASICSTIQMPAVSTSESNAALVTHALDDIAVLAPTLPNQLVHPTIRDVLITTNAGQIAAVQTLAQTPIHRGNDLAESHRHQPPLQPTPLANPRRSDHHHHHDHRRRHHPRLLMQPHQPAKPMLCT